MPGELHGQVVICSDYRDDSISVPDKVMSEPTVHAGLEKRVLMIAFHYPPCRGSSGLQRTLSFSRYLPRYGWTPLILTANSKAYPQVGCDQLADIPANIRVTRALAIDAARHLGIKGRYFDWMALPDRWISWFLGAVPAGLLLIRRHRPRVLWSTYPLATAHLIGFILHRLTGIPWIADFRDPMTEVDSISKQQWPSDPAVWRARRWIERITVQHCSRAVFVSATALRIYAERYSDWPESHWVLIANGYDEEHFVRAEQIAVRRSSTDRRILLLHSGILYPSPDRDPRCFVSALATLRREGKILSSDLKVTLRASGYEDRYRALIDENGVADIISLEPAIPYREALAEMVTSDGLLLFQGHDSNPAIPAKLYEYLRAKRPIFAMVDAEGDTAKALKAAGVGQIAPLNSEDQIASGLLEFLDQLRRGNFSTASHAEIHSHSREFRTKELATVLNTIGG